MFNSLYFKEQIYKPIKALYSIQRREFNDNQGGGLERFELEGRGKGCDVEFYSTGAIYVYLYDYKQDIELINIHIEVDENQKKKEILDELYKILKK